jgi:hypothetical protein
MSAELRDELAGPTRRIVDPRSVPVRFSNLKRMAQSPAHYRAACQYPDGDTLSRRLGRGVHAMLFGQPLVLWTGKVRNGKAWDAFEGLHSDKEILNAKEHAQASSITRAIRSNADAARLLFDGTTLERRIHWQLQGRDCAGTPDAVGPLGLVDLKTARTTEPDKFVRAASWMAYHAQLAWYRDGCELAGLPRPDPCFIVAVESVEPYAVTVLRLTERALDQGRRLSRLWFERLLVCEASNEWPSYSQSIVDFDLPDDEASGLIIDGEDFTFE